MSASQSPFVPSSSTGRFLAWRWRGSSAPVLALAVGPAVLLALATGSPGWVAAGAALGLAWGVLANRAGRAHASRQALLRSVVEEAPSAILLYSDSGRITLTNAAARELFFEGRQMEGSNFLSLLQNAPLHLRQALLAQGDGLFTVEVGGQSETFHLSRRELESGGQPHTLLLVKPLTRELSRQEVEVWKKVIRVMSHELNNSLAPISSLVHSARRLMQVPEQAERLDRIFDTLEERTAHLKSFLEGYAQLARLPRPVPREVEWERFLAGLQALFPQAALGSPPTRQGWFDPAQVEQVLINLLKNAQEAWGPPEAVSLDVEELEGGVRLSVADRGRGLSPEVLRNAMVPFYTTKEKGSGLGLALCREVVEAHRGRLWLENREGGGAVVSVWLPGRESSSVHSPSRTRLTVTRF